MEKFYVNEQIVFRDKSLGKWLWRCERDASGCLQVPIVGFCEYGDESSGPFTYRIFLGCKCFNISRNILH